jgi:hypothetical protein
VARKCTVCSHEEANAINEALVIEKASNRSIAKRYDVNHNAVQRHRQHVPEMLAQAKKAQEVADADDLLRQVRALQSKTLSILLKAEGAGELRTALAAIREARGNVELLARLAGELDTRPVINLNVSPEWLELRAVIVTALEPHPDARQAVVRAIGRNESGAESGNGRAG